MSRAVTFIVGLLILIATAATLGFRVWLANAPPQMRTTIEVMSWFEFASAVRHAIVPGAIPDHATYGREAMPGRGHAPWVMRSSLDGRPRILSIAAAPDVWLAYSTETATLHRLWRGELAYAGPVFNGQHGAEPLSRGDAWLSPPEQTAWRLFIDGREGPAQVQWLGHGFSGEEGQDLWLSFEVRDESGRSRRILEWPHIEIAGDDVTFHRRWQLGEGDLDVGLRITDDAGARMVRLEAEETSAILRFGAPRLEIAETSTTASAARFEQYDCSTCHGERERILGPAWGEIASRYQGANREAVTSRLAARIREGSAGQWGRAAMPAHPDLSTQEATALVTAILGSEPHDPPAARGTDAQGQNFTWDFHERDRPTTLHPTLRVRPIGPADFTPQVGGLAWLPDGRLAVATWDQDGAIFAIAAWDRDDARVKRIAEGLHEPLGLTVAGGKLYTIQKQEITQLVDDDGDDRVEEYRTLTNDWETTSNFHEFGFGFASIGEHLFAALSVCVLDGGKSCQLQLPDRGTLQRVSLETGATRVFARGLRTPNGVGQTPGDEVLVTDNQGDWLPASKLMVVREGDDYGWRPPGETRDPDVVTPPALWLPHHELANSPTQPIVLEAGPYKGHVVFGDIYNGGIKRAVLEEVDDRLQGAAFHWTGGLAGPVHRLLNTPDGRVVVGENGSRGNWGEPGKRHYGLELLSFEGEAAFEPLRVTVHPGGFHIEFGQPIGQPKVLGPEHFALESWYYVPTESYGGPRHGVRELPVSRVELSKDRRTATLDVPGLTPGRVIYIAIDRSLRSRDGDALWVDEAWYTLNALPAPEAPANLLTEAEAEAGWRLLFDGESFSGWKNYGASSGVVEGWRIENGTLLFTRDVSFAGLIWNHINPFVPSALDLMTRDRFSDFELRIDWKVAPGGNSGIFYAVPDEEATLSWDLGLEMQVLDDAGHADGQKPKRRAGDLYDLVASDPGISRPAGVWNEARIRVEGDRLRHWLNGELVVDITRGTREWDDAVANSKHAGVEGFGMAREGHITLQDHGDPVWYRNIKVLDLRDSRARTLPMAGQAR
jgi:cytochrome c551/c552